jgi:hypothetical protein
VDGGKMAKIMKAKICLGVATAINERNIGAAQRHRKLYENKMKISAQRWRWLAAGNGALAASLAGNSGKICIIEKWRNEQHRVMAVAAKW